MDNKPPEDFKDEEVKAEETKSEGTNAKETKAKAKGAKSKEAKSKGKSSHQEKDQDDGKPTPGDEGMMPAAPPREDVPLVPADDFWDTTPYRVARGEAEQDPDKSVLTL